MFLESEGRCHSHTHTDTQNVSFCSSDINDWFPPHPVWFTASRRTHRLDFDISYGHGEDGGGDEGHGAWIWYWTHLHLDATRLTLQVEIYRRVIHWEDNGRHTGWTLTSVQLHQFRMKSDILIYLCWYLSQLEDSSRANVFSRNNIDSRELSGLVQLHQLHPQLQPTGHLTPPAGGHTGDQSWTSLQHFYLLWYNIFL